MINEPNSARILRTYTAQRGCTVDCLAVSAIYKDAKHVLNSKYGQVKKTLNGLHRLSAPVKMIAVIKDLVTWTCNKRPVIKGTQAAARQLPKVSARGNAGKQWYWWQD